MRLRLRHGVRLGNAELRESNVIAAVCVSKNVLNLWPALLDFVINLLGRADALACYKRNNAL